MKIKKSWKKLNGQMELNTSGKVEANKSSGIKNAVLLKHLILYVKLQRTLRMYVLMLIIKTLAMLCLCQDI
jgi:hypothetical protein